MVVIIVLLCVFSLLIIWQFLGYPSLMGFIALWGNPKKKDYSYEPYVSIIIPALNEEKVIEKRIDNLLQLDYPNEKYEIIVVDDGSTDNTYQIVEELVKKHETNSEPHLKLVKAMERKGKASAINLGKQHAQGDIMLVTDANSLFNRNVLKEMMPHFENPNIGAVGGRYVVSNPESKLASSESFYWDLEYIMLRGESALQSACFFNGSINAWRGKIIEADNKVLSEDLEMAIQVRRAGYRIQYEPEAVANEPGATTSVDQIKQRKRTAIGTLQCMFKHRVYFLLPRDLYSLLIFPSHKGLAMVSPFTLSAIPILYIIVRSSTIIIPHLVATILAFVLMFGILMLLRARLMKPEKRTVRASIPSIFKTAHYVLLNEYIILLAWRDFLFGRHSVLWEKAESTR